MNSCYFTTRLISSLLIDVIHEHEADVHRAENKQLFTAEIDLALVETKTQNLDLQWLSILHIIWKLLDPFLKNCIALSQASQGLFS